VQDVLRTKLLMSSGAVQLSVDHLREQYRANERQAYSVRSTPRGAHRYKSHLPEFIPRYYAVA
jgi:hypothetical protein